MLNEFADMRVPFPVFLRFLKYVKKFEIEHCLNWKNKKSIRPVLKTFDATLDGSQEEPVYRGMCFPLVVADWDNDVINGPVPADILKDASDIYGFTRAELKAHLDVCLSMLTIKNYEQVIGKITYDRCEETHERPVNTVLQTVDGEPVGVKLNDSSD